MSRRSAKWGVRRGLSELVHRPAMDTFEVEPLQGLGSHECAVPARAPAGYSPAGHDRTAEIGALAKQRHARRTLLRGNEALNLRDVHAPHGPMRLAD